MGLPTGAITHAFETPVAGADGRFHPRSGKSPVGRGGVRKVTLLSRHLGLIDGSGMMASWTELPNNLA